MPNKYEAIVNLIGGRYSKPGRVALTGERIAEFEACQGYPLPTDYREFVRDYGGIGVNAI